MEIPTLTKPKFSELGVTLMVGFATVTLTEGSEADVIAALDKAGYPAKAAVS